MPDELQRAVRAAPAEGGVESGFVIAPARDVTYGDVAETVDLVIGVLTNAQHRARSNQQQRRTGHRSLSTAERPTFKNSARCSPLLTAGTSRPVSSSR